MPFPVADIPEEMFTTIERGFQPMKYVEEIVVIIALAIIALITIKSITQSLGNDVRVTGEVN
jgi:hypothetical protein